MKKVIFTGCTPEQHRWGSHTGDVSKLVVGTVYTIDSVDVHTWHTKVYLKEVDGSFNSVCFESATSDVS
jgi:hypothetical protein